MFMLNKEKLFPFIKKEDIKLNQIKNILKKLPWVLGKHPFLVFLLLTTLSLGWGVFLFYKYSFLAEKMEPEMPKREVQFTEELHQKILKEWEKREKRFKEADTKNYPNLFNPVSK